MTAPFELPRRRRHVATSRTPTTLQAGALRALLLARMEEQTTRFAQYGVELDAHAANLPADPTSLGRALAALHMYRARRAIEEIEDALVRIEDGSYGTCELCEAPIPLERLESIPEARCCPACRAEPASSADRSATSHVAPIRGEHTGATPPRPVCSPPALRTSSSGSARTRGARPLGEEIGEKQGDPRDGVNSAPASGAPHDVHVRRLYDHIARGEAGYRVLVDRLWPRGVTKADADLDEWLKEAAPTTDLMRWYDYDVQRFEEFARRYRAELQRPPGSVALADLIGLARTRTITLVTTTRDIEHSGAQVLKELLTSRASRSARPKATRHGGLDD